MRIPVNRMTCWELADVARRSVATLIDDGGIEEHDFPTRNLLLAFLASVDELRMGLRDRRMEIAQQ